MIIKLRLVIEPTAWNSFTPYHTTRYLEWITKTTDAVVCLWHETEDSTNPWNCLQDFANVCKHVMI